MTLDLLVFLEASDAALVVLKKLRGVRLTKVDRLDALCCRFVSSDPYYLRVKIPYPTDDEPDGWLLCAIPHVSVRMMIQPDRELTLGFVQDLSRKKRRT